MSDRSKSPESRPGVRPSLKTLPGKAPTRPSKKKSRGPSPKRGTNPRPEGRWAALIFELLALLLAGLVGTISVLGHAAEWFGGSDLTQSLLPFSGTVLILALSAALLLPLWQRLRRLLVQLSPNATAVAALLVLMLALGYAAQSDFRQDLERLRNLVGGVSEAGRSRLAHQVFANYRRSDRKALETILLRAAPYRGLIEAAAKQYQVEGEILIGMAVTESSFLPRDSRDGGKGLFQITQVPPSVTASVARFLGGVTPNPALPRDNSYLAAATFRHYLNLMGNDLLLGLLAYNIGPRNGGLASIMTQYGARDFFAIQPYLKDLPGDYPIRVLTAALADRVFRLKGELPAYERDGNARVIQSIGIPGLDLRFPELPGEQSARNP